MNADKYKENPIELVHKDVTDKILYTIYKIVYPELGYGFLEKVYENAMAIAILEPGFHVQKQAKTNVYFHNEIVGEYFADLLVNDVVIVELKTAARLTADHEAQLLNYLRATRYEVGLLLNFGPKPEFCRKAFSNERKTPTCRPKN